MALKNPTYMEARLEQRIADLKRQLEKANERAEQHYKMYEEALDQIYKRGNQLRETRAHADALAGALEDTNKALSGAKAEAECLGRELDKIATLKRKLSKSIEREQEIERELDALRDAWRELRRAHGKTVEELEEERARADALAGALEGMRMQFEGGALVRQQADEALKAHRQARRKDDG